MLLLSYSKAHCQFRDATSFVSHRRGARRTSKTSGERTVVANVAANIGCSPSSILRPQETSCNTQTLVFNNMWADSPRVGVELQHFSEFRISLCGMPTTLGDLELLTFVAPKAQRICRADLVNLRTGCLAKQSKKRPANPQCSRGVHLAINTKRSDLTLGNPVHNCLDPMREPVLTEQVMPRISSIHNAA